MSQASDSLFKEGDKVIYCPKSLSVSRGRQGTVIGNKNVYDYVSIEWPGHHYRGSCCTRDIVKEEKCRQCEYGLIHVVNGTCPCAAHFKKKKESIDT